MEQILEEIEILKNKESEILNEFCACQEHISRLHGELMTIRSRLTFLQDFRKRVKEAKEIPLGVVLRFKNHKYGDLVVRLVKNNNYYGFMLEEDFNENLRKYSVAGTKTTTTKEFLEYVETKYNCKLYQVEGK